jgi:hypothetical protein
MLYTMCLNCLKLLHVTEHTLDLCTCEKSWLFIHNLHCLVLFCIIGILIWWPCIKRSGCWFFSCYKHLQITYWQRRKQERWFVSPLPSLLNVSWQNWIEGDGCLPTFCLASQHPSVVGDFSFMGKSTNHLSCAHLFLIFLCLHWYIDVQELLDRQELHFSWESSLLPLIWWSSPLRFTWGNQPLWKGKDTTKKTSNYLLHISAV